MLHEPFYDPALTFEENAARGPFGAFASAETFKRTDEPAAELFGHGLWQPFGIPAGPVMTSRHVAAAFRLGFDVVVYKTVRSQALKSHPLPNVVPLTIEGNLTIERAKQPLVAGSEYREPLTITNSFGVPSTDPNVWQPDLQRAVDETPIGQLVIGSFQGTNQGSNQAAFIQDFATTAKLVAETGVHVLETNLSCPNEGTNHLVCFDTDITERIVHAIKSAVPDRPLVIKIAYFDHNKLPTFVERIGPLVEGISAINTIPAPIVDEQGNQALSGQGRLVSGVCGDAIRWAGLEMVERLATLRTELNLRYQILGVGGVMNPADYQLYRKAGADAVLSATGAMWNPYLARHIWEAVHD